MGMVNYKEDKIIKPNVWVAIAVFQCIRYVTLHHSFSFSKRWGMERSNEGQSLAAWA